MKDFFPTAMSAACALALMGAGLIASGCAEAPAQCTSCDVNVLPNEGWQHVPEGSSIEYLNSPPASGPHYPVWATYRIHDEVVPVGYWMHNLEHHGMVILYRPDISADALAALKKVYNNIPADDFCGIKMVVMTADPDLETPVAAVTADHVLAGDSLSDVEVQGMYQSCRCSAPEYVCGDGSYPGVE